MQKILFFFFSCLAAVHLQAQESDKAAVKSWVNSKNFVFRARSVTPMSGMTRQLSSDYDLRMIGDSMIAYLPYFGRAYVAPAPGEGGVNFTSTHFQYDIRQTKKGGWDIVIKPMDAKDIRQVVLSVSKNGYASLQLTSNNRQPISYQGYITGENK